MVIWYQHSVLYVWYHLLCECFLDLLSQIVSSDESDDDPSFY